MSRIPEFFPRVKGCEGPGGKFLECFGSKAQKEGAEDTMAGVLGLKACSRELAAYETCMGKVKQEQRRYRVQEEYRSTQKQSS